jgi:hypothetical protein
MAILCLGLMADRPSDPMTMRTLVLLFKRFAQDAAPSGRRFAMRTALAAKQQAISECAP